MKAVQSSVAQASPRPGRSQLFYDLGVMKHKHKIIVIHRAGTLDEQRMEEVRRDEETMFFMSDVWS